MTSLPGKFGYCNRSVILLDTFDNATGRIEVSRFLGFLVSLSCAAGTVKMTKPSRCDGTPTILNAGLCSGDAMKAVQREQLICRGRTATYCPAMNSYALFGQDAVAWSAVVLDVDSSERRSWHMHLAAPVGALPTVCDLL